MDMLRIFLAVFLAVASLAVGIQLARGQWSYLVFSLKNIPSHELAQANLLAPARARTASPVAFCFFAADITLLVFEICRQLEAYEVASVFSALCDVSMIAFVIAAISFYVRSGALEGKNAKFRSSTFRMNLFVLVHVVLLTMLALLF